LRLGYSQFVVDPNVRLAYTHRDAADVYKPQFVKGIRKTDWADVQSSPPINWSLTPHRPYYKCAAPGPSYHIRQYLSLHLGGPAVCGVQALCMQTALAAHGDLLPAARQM
jgi:hypothetical protein